MKVQWCKYLYLAEGFLFQKVISYLRDFIVRRHVIYQAEINLKFMYSEITTHCGFNSFHKVTRIID